MDSKVIIEQRVDKLLYREGNNTVKLFDKEFEKDIVLYEALNHAIVEKTGLPVPHINSVTLIDDKWALIYEYVEGKTLEVLMKENPEKEDEYLELFVNLQIEVQSHTCQKLAKLKDKMNFKISQADIPESTKYELHERLEAMPKHKKLCHGDFNPSNIIITPEGKPVILDWSHATIGNASADVARTYLLFNLNGQPEIAKKYLDLFCKKTDTAKKYVQSWMPIVACSQSVKGHEEERQFLLSWVNVVDY